MDLNKVILVGRLTKDPELKSLPSGTQVTSFGLATGRTFKDKSGQKQQQTEFHNIVLFGRSAEIASQYLSKGALALIEGRLQTRNWKDSTGVTKYRTEIVGERMQLGPRSAVKTGPAPMGEAPAHEEIPIIEEEQNIDIKDIPF